VPLGDAQIKNLTDRLNMLASGSGDTHVFTDVLSSSGPGWQRISAPATLDLVLVGREVCIEASGRLEWRAGANLSFAGGIGPDIPGSWPNAEAKIDGATIPIAITMAWHCQVTFTVISGGVNPLVRVHVSGAMSPLIGNMAGGTPPGAGGGSNFNAIPFEGDNGAAGIGIGVIRRFTLGAAYQTTAAGQSVAAYRTKISYYGG
jgi:hypothetical protein